MTLRELVAREDPEEHFHGDYKIPWDERAFSRRLLDEHLDQSHDAASRPFETVDRHVAWIHQSILGAKPSKILDVCCGPGLYGSRLARLGHTYTGFDFAPSSIAYARAEAEDHRLSCSYVKADVREAEFGDGYDLAMLLFGEFNAFAPAEIRAILRKMHDAVRPAGRVVFEPSRLDALHRLGTEARLWSRHDAGLFSDRPHLYLEEHFWDDERHVLADRYYVVDAETGDITEFVNTRQGYTQAQLAELLGAAGFEGIEFHASLTGSDEDADEDLMAVTARRAQNPLRRNGSRG